MNNKNKNIVLAGVIFGTMATSNVAVNVLAENPVDLIKINKANLINKTTSEVINFSDANLAKAINKNLDRAEGTPITKADMAGLEKLDLSYGSITNLNGIQFATNLKSLDLRSNYDLTDISYISSMKSLESLHLGDLDIVNLDDIEGLTNLKVLELRGNSELKTIKAIKNLTNLEKLTLRIYIANDVFDCDITPINGLPKLKYLSFEDDSFGERSDYSVLNNLPSLEEVDFGGYYYLKDIEFLDNFRNLKKIDLSYTSVSDLTPLRNLTKLEELNLYSAELLTLNGLENAINLKSLNACMNVTADGDLYDISALKNCVNLEKLDLSYNEISDISALENLTKIHTLDLGSNRISDISSLKNMTNLKDLDIYDNNITSIESLRNITTITSATMNKNRIADFTPLSNCNLTYKAIYNQTVTIKGEVDENGKAVMVNPIKSIDGSSVTNITLDADYTSKLSFNENGDIVLENIPSNSLMVSGIFNENKYSSTSPSGVVIFDFSNGKDLAIDFSQDKTEWTNDGVNISVVASAIGEDVVKIKLPNDKYIEGNTASYKAYSNGNYKFIAETESGRLMENIIAISNIDKDRPEIKVEERSLYNGTKILDITAKDLQSGIDRILLPNEEVVQVEDGKDEINHVYNFDATKDATFKAYDKVGNVNIITVKVNGDIVVEEDNNENNNTNNNNTNNNNTNNNNTNNNNTNNNNTNSDSNNNNSTNNNASNSNGEGNTEKPQTGDTIVAYVLGAIVSSVGLFVINKKAREIK